LAGKLEGGLGVRMSHVDHLAIIVPHVFDRGRIALLNRPRRRLARGPRQGPWRSSVSGLATPPTELGATADR
jgi:hypothetical protein